MRKKVLMIIWGALAVLAVFLATAFSQRDRDLSPNGIAYQLKLTGEWLDVNFFVFGAPEKQSRHLELAERRLHEYLRMSSDHLSRPSTTAWGTLSPFGLELMAERSQGEGKVAGLRRHYELELARAEYMAEQLALLDHKFIPNIEMVFQETLHHLRHLREVSATKESRGFIASAKLYNDKAIKVLIRKHLYDEQDRQRYIKLINEYRGWAEDSALSAAQSAKLGLAKKVLNEGLELEWAYDLISEGTP
ncbi:MAG: hypothetical protein HY397_03995 [Candidatus Doudnabacteria bacterium]|nr:hypothetical protein [Candidatus Doudnabacteria bacterium]